MVLVGSVDHLKEEFGPDLGKKDVSQFIENEEIVPLQLFLEALEPLFLPTLHELDDQSGDGMEADLPAQGAGGKG